MTTDNRRYALNAQLDIQQILLEAQHRWLRPAEICEILQNYRNFSIAPEPPNRPPSGSLFLFDRKVLRYFRKDGHNWRKKRDGKTVKEAHERLKAGSVDVLHCYYAHGEDNESFQRRSYWMLEEELSNIVLVHYREVKGNRTNFSRLRDAASRRTEEDASYSEAGSSGVSRFPSYDYQGASQVTDTASLNSIQASEREDAESVYRHQASPGLQPVQESQSPTSQTMETGSVPYYSVSTSSGYQGSISTIPIDNGFPYQIQQDHAFQSWENAVEGSNSAYQPVNFQSSFAPAQSSALSTMTGQENELLDQVVTGHFGRGQVVRTDSHISQGWQVSVRDSSNWSAGQNSDGLSLGQSPYYPPLRQPLVNETINPNDANQVDLSSAVSVQNAYITDQTRQLLQDDHQLQELNGVGKSVESYSDGNLSAEDKTNYLPLKQPLLDGVSRESLKKLDSFDRWISKELDDVTNETIPPSSTLSWETVKGEDGDESDISTHVPLDNYILSPSLAQEQLFSIVEFSPNWAYSETEIKVLVVGRFLIRQEEALKCRWACMFGKIEVPAVVVADGVLQCRTPSYENGMIPFYVTCSNRLACSEVREFEFRPIEDADIVDASTITSDETLLHMRFGKLLSLESSTSQTSIQSSTFEITQLCRKINAMLKDDSEWEQMVNLTRQDEFSPERGKDQLLQKLLKEKLNIWLLQKIAEGGKGPSVLDEGGQGVLHFAAALGYDWAIAPTVVAGVSINFRDVNGWTALHWAAYTGRENTVGLLISLGAAPGFVTHPTPKYPSGRTPSDLASSNGHKGISGYLAESSLSSHLSSITLKDSNRSDQGKAVATVSERTATPVGDGDLPQGLSMKDSLAALRNAHQAAARIHQVYRAQSFQRKQIKEYGDREVGISDDRALSLSLLALRNKKAGQHDEPVYAAAVRIQNKFRSWKGRKDFLLIRQRIIKIQAHVRGHQVRKNYRKIILWSVGILDKVILRWRRKGKGLSGFKPEAHAASSSTGTGTQEDEYEYLKEGKKQTEERLQKALARVKSMVQYPDARDQYRRVLNVVQEKKAAYDRILNNPEVDFDDDLFDFSELLDDDTFMPMTS